MNLRLLSALPLLLAASLPGRAQSPAPARPTPPAATAPTAVPALIPYAGVALDAAGKPLAGSAPVTFLLFREEQGGEPLWAETQTVAIDSDGHYGVQLGASSLTGLPLTAFASGEARWLEVQIPGQQAQPRALIASVPYAIKSADAEALAGHAAADFVTQEQLAQFAALASQSHAGGVAPDTTPAPGTVTGAGSTGTVPLWTGANTQGNSGIVQVGTDVGINQPTPASTLDVGGAATVRGLLALPPTAPATSAAGTFSQTLQISSSSWSSATSAPIAQKFNITALPVGNNTASPSGNLLFQYQAGTGPATGLFSVASNGIINFNPAQTFPGTVVGAIGLGPIVTGMTGHDITINFSIPTLETTLNTIYPRIGAANTFNGPQTIKGTLDVTSTLTGQSAVLSGTATASEGFISNGSVLAKPATTATATAGVNSPLIELEASSFSSGSNAPVAQNFAWQAQAAGNDTASPTASLDLLYGPGAPAPTGLSISPRGIINFASGQTFPVAGTGGGTITGITTGSPLTGSGTAGSVALGLNETALETSLNSVYPQLNAANTFTQNQTFNADVSVSGGLTSVGDVLVSPLQTATATDSSQSFGFLGVGASAWNSGTQAAVPQTFGWSALPVNSNTANPSAELDLTFGAGTAAVAPTGLSINSSGILTFATGQTFPGAGTITEIRTSNGVLGGGTSGTIHLSLDPSVIPTLSDSPVFTSAATSLQGTSYANYANSAGVLGLVNSPSGITEGNAGVWGDSYVTIGVLGTSNESPGVEGVSATSYGVEGSSTSNTGVLGTSSSGTGVSGLSTSSSGVAGYTPGTTLNTAGVLGKAGSVSGDSHIVAGVWGDSYQNAGVEGTSNQSVGVYGQSSVDNGVQGVSTSGPGVAGSSSSGAGMVGYTSGSTLNTAGAIGIAGARTSFSGISGLWGDSASNVGVFGSSSLYSGVQGSSVSGPGVQGNSTSGNGVHGVSSSTSGIFGETSSASGSDAALFGYSHSGAMGVYGASASGPGIVGTSSASNGVMGTATGSGAGVTASGTSGYGIYATATSGVAVNAQSTTGAAAIFSSSSNAPTLTAYNLREGGNYEATIAILGSGGALTSTGVEGIGNHAAGVYGVANHTTDDIHTVFGYLNAGVWADSTGTDNDDTTEVTATAVLSTAHNSTSGYFQNNSGNFSTLYLYNYGSAGTDVARRRSSIGGETAGLFNTLQASNPQGTCGFGGSGDMSCTGQVKTLVTTGGGARKVETYAPQSAENWMEDYGTGVMERGVAVVKIDPAFAETASQTANYHVFLTPNADSKGLYVIHKTGTTFEVRESGGGTSSMTFDYKIVAKRRGYEAQRLVDVTDRYTTALKAIKQPVNPDQQINRPSATPARALNSTTSQPEMR